METFCWTFEVSKFVIKIVALRCSVRAGAARAAAAAAAAAMHSSKAKYAPLVHDHDTKEEGRVDVLQPPPLVKLQFRRLIAATTSLPLAATIVCLVYTYIKEKVRRRSF